MNFFSLFKRNIIYKFKKKKSIDSDNFPNKSLDELFFFYGSDKANYFKKENRIGHGYSKFYINHLEQYKNKKINILEIGSFAGASAAAFVKYFKNSNVYCFDINISNFYYKSKFINVFGLDINNEKTVITKIDQIFNLNHINKFDIIIEDGSHYLSDILKSLNFFLKYLRDGGYYIIEDFKHPNYYDYNKDINHIYVDDFLNNIKNKKISTSSIFSEIDQNDLINSIKKIEFHKGNLSDSDICFIQKK